MVRDVFIEEIVKKKKEPLDWLKIIAILVLCLALAVAFLFLGMFFPFCWVLAGLSIYFGYFFISRRSIEFEYSLTNDTFDVDKIIAKRTRKRLISTSCKNFDDFGQYYPEDSVIHKLDPRVKLFGTLVFVVMVFMINNVIGYGLITLFLGIVRCQRYLLRR